MKITNILRISSIFAIMLLSLWFSLLQTDPLVFLYSGHDTESLILWQLRLPRTLTGFVSGALLALAGSLMQLLLRNPLADPYALGISSGSAFFTLLLMLIGCREHALFLGSILGAMCSMGIIILLSRRHHYKSHALLLSGIAIAYALSAGISLLLLLSKNNTIQSMLFWLSGDLNTVSVPYGAIAILSIGSFLCVISAPYLNILLRGETKAALLGVNVSALHVFLFLLSSVFTAAAVSISGCVGFIGLLIPHFTRHLTHNNYHVMLPLNIILGGSFLVFADTLARLLLNPLQIPVGIITALFGVPIYLWLVIRCS